MKVLPESVAIVTGGASGIGRAIAAELARRGARVALLDVDRAGLEEAERAIPGATAHPCDVGEEASVRSACGDVVVQSHGRLNLLVNVAGISVAGPVDEVPLAEFHRAMNVNFWGIVHTVRSLLPHLRAAASRGEPAAICNVLSDFALFSLPTKSPYAASKHAARALTEALGAELTGSSIEVSAAYPGATATGIVSAGFAVDAAKQKAEADFLQKGLSPEAVAGRIVRGIEKGRARILVGRDTRAIDAAARLSPALLQAGIRRLWRRVPFL